MEETENKEITVQEEAHESLFLALSYLPVYELLVMSRVCKSFRDAILKEDVLPWMNILIEKPLNSRLTNENLFKITSKSDGRLGTLALLNCTKITDEGLQKVVACNPNINKLYVPGCSALTPEGVIKAVKLLTRSDHKLSSIRVNGIHNMRKEDLEILQNLIIEENQKEPKLYDEFKKLTILKLKETTTTSPSIDMDLCPRCNEIRAIYDCRRDSCKQQKVVECRGCRYCIPRCEECGICIKDEEEEEAACSDGLCLACWIQLPKCSFCNKPYCSNHADLQCFLPGSLGFVCTPCHVKFVEKS